jgi:hypothetical protein
VVVRSIVRLLRFEPRLPLDFAGFDAATFCTFARAGFSAFAGPGAAATFCVTGVARGLRGALLAGLKAKVITPAAIAAATTVNFCM